MSQERGQATRTTESTSERSRTDIAFVFSLIGGILIAMGPLIGFGLTMAMGEPRLFFGMGSYNNFSWMGMMMGPQYYYGMMYGLGLLGVIAGSLVIISAILLRSGSIDRVTSGILIIAFSLVGLAGMGGFFFIGTVLGLIGGVLALVEV